MPQMSPMNWILISMIPLMIINTMYTVLFMHTNKNYSVKNKLNMSKKWPW